MTRRRMSTWAAVLPAALAFLPLSAAAAVPAPPDTTDGTGVAQSPCFSRDNVDPRLLSVSADRTTVDVSQQPGSITFTVVARDGGGPGPASGVGYVRVRFAKRVDRHTGVTLRHVSGDRWQGTLAVGLRVRGGDDGVRSVLVRDKAGNVQVAPGRLSFSVVSSSDGDTEAPVLQSVTVAPGTVADTRRHSQRVTVTALATDAGGSGVAGVRVRWFALGSRASFDGPIETVLRPTTGDRLRGTVTVPTWAGSSTWTVAYAGVSDRAGNTRLYEDDERAQLGAHQSFQVVSGLDRTRPRLGAVRGLRSRLDVRNHGGWVTLSVRASDAAAGIAGVRAHLELPRPGNPDPYLTGSQPLRLTSGNLHDGVWTVRFRLRACSLPASGRYRAAVDGSDRARNPLSTRRSSTTVAVSTRPLTGAVVVAGRLALPSGPPVLSFDRPVVGIDSRSARAFEFDQDGTLHPVTGTWVCATASGAVTSCRTGRVRVAALEPDVASTNPGPAYVLLNPAGVLEVRDRSGIPFRRAKVFYSRS